MKQYPAYKDSGVKWVGKVPSAWGLIRLKYLTSFRNGYAFDSDEYSEDGLPIMRIGDVCESIDLETMKKVPRDYERIYQEFGINYGDVLLALTGATIGKTAVFNLHEKVLLNQRVAIIRPRKKLDNGYLKYIVAFSGFKEHIDFECEGGAQDNIGKSEVGDFLTSVPDLAEQKSIGDYLDRKTAQIDGLIAKKERMIELLKEERAAVINQIVTKGLDPKVEMKDSGIEWLGKVPKHWEMKRLKYLVSLINQSIEDEISVTTKIDLENLESWTGKIIEIENQDLSVDGMKAFAIGDVLFNKLRPYLAKVYRAQECGVCGGELLVLRPTSLIDSDFLFYRVSSSDFINVVDGSTYGTKMPRASWDFIGTLCVPFPEKAEQVKIAEYLGSFFKKTDLILKKLVSEIEYLKEYRTALISEVVTGKICLCE